MREHNPLFLASALSMLAGCWAIEHGLQLAPGHLRGLLLLAGVLQVYEALLLGLIVALARRGVERDARFLVAIEAAFLLDVSLAHLEISTASVPLGAGLTGVLLALAVTKWNVLRVSLRVGAAPPLRRIALAQLAAALAFPVVLAWLAAARRLDAPALHALAWLLAPLPVAWWWSRGEPGHGELALRVHQALRIGPPLALALHVLAVGWVHDVTPWPALLAPLVLGLAVRNILDQQVVSRLPMLAMLLSLAAPESMATTVLGVGLTPWRLTLLGAAGAWMLATRFDRLAGVLVVMSLVAALGGATPWELARRGDGAVSAVLQAGAVGWGIAAVALAFVLLGLGARATLRTGGAGTPPRPSGRRRTTSRSPLVEAIVAGACGLAVLAVAAPSHSRARTSANESAAIAWMRTVVSAQSAWAADHGGTFTTLSCLEDPPACGEPPSTAPYLPRGTAGERAGYARRLHAGPAVDPRRLPSYTLSATPIRRGGTGVRSFAAGSDGRICAEPEGGEIPGMRSGTSLGACRELR